MANFMFYTDEGYTISPINTELDSFQILGFEEAIDLKEGIEKLLKNNSWIEKSGFNIEKIKYHLILESSS